MILGLGLSRGALGGPPLDPIIPMIPPVKSFLAKFPSHCALSFCSRVCKNLRARQSACNSFSVTPADNDDGDDDYHDDDDDDGDDDDEIAMQGKPVLIF